MKASELWGWIERLDSTNSPVQTADILSNLFKCQRPDHAIRLLVGQPFADFEKDLGIGKRSVRKALGAVYDEWQSGQRSDLEKELGDLSLAVKECKPVNRPLIDPVEPTVKDLLDALHKIEQTSGSNDKIDLIVDLLQMYTQKHVIVFALLNDVSFGVSWKTVIRALEQSTRFTEHELKRTYGLHPDVGMLVYNVVICDRVYTKLSPFYRIAPMLASGAVEQRATDVYQTKYDGSRLLIHHDGNEIKAFSRQQHDITDSIPELQAADWPDKSFVIDAEAVAYDHDGNVQNFQEIMKRFGREHDIDQMMEQITVEFKVFDCLLYRDHDLTEEPYHKRWNRVLASFKDFAADTSINRDKLMAESLERGHEGIIVKDMAAPYLFERDRAWRKVKADPETVDLVVTDVFEAEGKLRRKLGQPGIGSVAVETSDGVPLGNVGTGFKEIERVDLYESIEGTVIEVEFEELQEGQSGGYGLRFPRFIRLRPDGTADSLHKLKDL